MATNALATVKNPVLFFRDFTEVRMRWGFFDIVVKDGSSPAVSCAYYYKKSSSLFS